MILNEEEREEIAAKYNLHFCIREEDIKLDTTDVDIFFTMVLIISRQNKHRIYYCYIYTKIEDKVIEIPRAFDGQEPFCLVESLFDDGIEEIIKKIEEEKKIPRLTKEWYEEHIAHLRSVKKNREEILNSRKGWAMLDSLQKEIDDLDMNIQEAEKLYKSLFGRK